MSTIPSIATRFTERLGIRHPFACAGMAFAGLTPDLAIAVSKAGGIGAIGVGFTPPHVLREYIRAVKVATPSPFNVNCITCFDNDAQVEVCAEEGVPIVSWHWGHPSDENRRILRDAGVSSWEQVGSVDDAKRAVDDGAEVVIAQGYEAGGHNYQGLAGQPGLPTFVLLPTLVDAVGSQAMVLGSGGISDGRGVAAALALGADAVWVGTRMVATTEASVHDEHKRRIVAAKGEDTVFSSIFGPEWPHFNPMRLQRNRVVTSTPTAWPRCRWNAADSNSSGRWCSTASRRRCASSTSSCPRRRSPSIPATPPTSLSFPSRLARSFVPTKMPSNSRVIIGFSPMVVKSSFLFGAPKGRPADVPSTWPARWNVKAIPDAVTSTAETM